MSVEYQIRETLSRIHQREARLNVGEVKGLPLPCCVDTFTVRGNENACFQINPKQFLCNLILTWYIMQCQLVTNNSSPSPVQCYTRNHEEAGRQFY